MSIEKQIIRDAQKFNEDFKKFHVQLKRQINFAVIEKVQQSLEPIRKLTESLNSGVFAHMNEVFEAIKKASENNDKVKLIRGEIITDVIMLDDMIENLLLKRYVKKEDWDEVQVNFLTHQACSSSLKKEVLFMSGLLNKHKKLKKNIDFLYYVRNRMAHSKYKPTRETVLIFDKKKIKDAFTLKDSFDELHEGVMDKLNDIYEDMKDDKPT